MKAHLQYLGYVVRHKWLVFVECCRLGIPWQGLIHDWSKFLPSEWFSYVGYFYGEKDEAAFDLAWLLHQKRNPHHWQWWVMNEDNPAARYCIQAIQPEVGPYYLFDIERQAQIAEFGLGFGCKEGTSEAVFAAMLDVERALARGSLKVLPMPDRYRREMLADWKGAGLAQGKPDTRAWYKANREKMLLHPETREWVERQLGLR